VADEGQALAINAVMFLVEIPGTLGGLEHCAASARRNRRPFGSLRPPETSAGANRVIAESTWTCPNCGHTKTEPMPTDSCQWFYECEDCPALLRPSPAAAAGCVLEACGLS
jgi:hypothetical protein